MSQTIKIQPEQKARFKTIEQIKTAHKKMGGHFFEPTAMRFFNSRIGKKVYVGRYFITSEQFDEKSPRRYTIREAQEDGSIDTIGDYQQYKSSVEAVNGIKKLLSQ